MGLALGMTFIVVIAVWMVRRERRIQKTITSEDWMETLQELLDSGVISSETEVKLPREIGQADLTILKPLGEGNFGVVHKAQLDEQKRTGVPSFAVAVKTIKNATAADIKSFRFEASLNFQLVHPNIVGLVGVVTRSEPMMMVVQFAEHGELLAYLGKQASITVETGLEMLRQIATGLRYLNVEMKFVHRDLAARNVLVTEDLKYKISDFGMGKALKSGAEEHEANYVASNTREPIPVRWAAPEVLTDSTFSPASDLWALGIIGYEIFSLGGKPYAELTNPQVWESVGDKTEPYIPLECPARYCPVEVWTNLLCPCFEKDRSKRWKIDGFIGMNQWYTNNLESVGFKHAHGDGSTHGWGLHAAKENEAGTESGTTAANLDYGLRAPQPPPRRSTTSGVSHFVEYDSTLEVQSGHNTRPEEYESVPRRGSVYSAPTSVPRSSSGAYQSNAEGGDTNYPTKRSSYDAAGYCVLTSSSPSSVSYRRSSIEKDQATLSNCTNEEISNLIGRRIATARSISARVVSSVSSDATDAIDAYAKDYDIPSIDGARPAPEETTENSAYMTPVRAKKPEKGSFNAAKADGTLNAWHRRAAVNNKLGDVDHDEDYDVPSIPGELLEPDERLKTPPKTQLSKISQTGAMENNYGAPPSTLKAVARGKLHEKWM